MVDGVNFNPFTNKVWTTEEIEKIDTDKNGTVSYAEMQANISWLTGSTDEEGEVLIGEESSPSVTLSDNEAKIYSAAAKNGVQDTAADSTQLQQYMNTIIDSYIEQYMQKNPGLDQNQKNSLITFIKSQGEEFVNSYLQNNTAVPYNTQSVAQSLIQTLDSAVQQRNDLATDVNNQINDLKNNVDANYDKLSSTTNAADDDYVTSSEFQQMKDEAIAYLMGTMLNGAEDSEFLTGLNPNYKNDANYKIAMAAINSINNETDPAKIQEYLEQAKNALSNLIGTQNVDGTSKLNDTVISSDTSKAETAKAAQTAEYTETLTATIDKMVENYSNANPNDENISEKIANYKTQLTNIMNKFLETYNGSGKNIEAEFKVFANEVMQDSAAVQNELEGITSTHSADAIVKLENVVNGTGDYISEDEKQAIVNASVDFILNQLAQGVSDISLLEQISPTYATNDKFIEAKALLNGIESSATPKEDLEKVKQLLTEMMTEIGADKIADGVKNRQMPEITFSDVEREQFTSSIPGYDNNANITSAEFKGNSGKTQAKNDLQNKAKAMLENLKPQLLQMIKDKMGADYDEDTANKLIDDAIYQTINDITDSINVEKTNRRLLNKNKKYEASISTQQLIDTFMNNLLANSAKDAAGPEEGKNPVDRESVLRNTELADRYQDKSASTTRSLKIAQLMAKSQLQIIAAQLKTQLMNELGADYDSSKINSMINQAISTTLDSVEATKKGSSIIARYTVNTNTIANTFFDEFDKLYEESNKSSS